MRFFQRNFFKLALGCAGVLGVLLIASCQKYKDTPGKPDPRLNRHYCNDPDAVNFNRDFPGIADNSVCIYPADAFAGTYSFVDSITDGNNSVPKEVPLTLRFTAIDHTKFYISGLCPSGGQINFTTSRSLLASVDSIVASGQLLCRPTDTLSGNVFQSIGDTSKVRVSLIVVSDSGVNYHQGTAYRQ